MENKKAFTGVRTSWVHCVKKPHVPNKALNTRYTVKTVKLDGGFIIVIFELAKLNIKAY